MAEVQGKRITPQALANLQKVFGKESIMQLSDGPLTEIDRIGSGSLYLDHILGGGWPLGRIVEIYGQESSGKSSTCLHLLSEAQNNHSLVCGYIDMEGSFDTTYAKALGVDTDSLLLSQPNNGEEALDIAIAMVKTGEIKVLIIDSTSTLVPKSEIEGDTGDHAVGLQARLLSKSLRMITPLALKNNCIIIFISQLREKIGISFGDPRVIGVGNAMKFYASIRLEVSKAKAFNGDGDEPVGHTMKFQTKKNKTFPPFKKAEIVFRYGEGFDKFSEVVDLATQMKIIEKSGSWYAYKETRLGQGSENVIKVLKDNPELFEELRGLVVEGLKQQ